MFRLPRPMLAAAAALALALLPATAPASADTGLASDRQPASYIVTLAETAAVPTTLARHQLQPSQRFVHAINGFAATLTPDQVAALRDDPAVIAIEADQVMTINANQLNPPSWGLDRIDQRFLPLDASYTFNTTAAGVHAYIIDTGIDPTHFEFGNRATQAVNFAGGPAQDCHGHGTHVAGIVGATSYGVAKQVNLYGVKVLDCNGAGSIAGVIAGIDWVAANHTKPAVANLSLGGGASLALDQAVNNLANSGVFVATAAGSSNTDACNQSPARAANSTTVMASSSNDTRAPSSNFGPCTHLYAPGVGITSTVPNNGAATFSGTSMAAPHVAAVAAMYKATFGDHAFNVIRHWLQVNATRGVISGNPPNTPNLLLFTRGL